MSFLSEQKILERFEKLENQIKDLQRLRNVDCKDYFKSFNDLTFEINKLKKNGK